MTIHPQSDQSENFFETLSGRDDQNPGAKVMREAVLDELETTSAADVASDETLTDEERATLRNVKARMMHNGAWPAARPSVAISSKSGASDVPGPLGTISRLLGISLPGKAWQSVLGLALVVVLGSIVVVKGLLPLASDLPLDSNVVRGEQGPVVYVKNAHRAAEALAEKLNALNAEATAVPINKRKAIVEVVIPNSANFELIQQTLFASGFRLTRSHSYTLTLQESDK